MLAKEEESLAGAGTEGWSKEDSQEGGESGEREVRPCNTSSAEPSVLKSGPVWSFSSFGVGPDQDQDHYPPKQVDQDRTSGPDFTKGVDQDHNCLGPVWTSPNPIQYKLGYPSVDQVILVNYNLVVCKLDE